jgi:hypothetical protein
MDNNHKVWVSDKKYKYLFYLLSSFVLFAMSIFLTIELKALSVCSGVLFLIFAYSLYNLISIFIVEKRVNEWLSEFRCSEEKDADYFYDQTDEFFREIWFDDLSFDLTQSSCLISSSILACGYQFCYYNFNKNNVIERFCLIISQKPFDEPSCTVFAPVRPKYEDSTVRLRFGMQEVKHPFD